MAFSQQRKFFQQGMPPVGQGGVILDLGFHRGEFSEMFLERTEMVAYGWDLKTPPNYTDMLGRWGDRLTFYDLGAWDRYESLPILGEGEGCSVCNGRVDSGEEADMTRISDWMLTNLEEDDYVICKVDIEGAEFRVLWDLHDTGAFDLVDVWFVDWHHHKMAVPPKPATVLGLSEIFARSPAKNYHWMHRHNQVDVRDIVGLS